MQSDCNGFFCAQASTVQFALGQVVITGACSGCSGHGWCTDVADECVCDAGFTGDACQTIITPSTLPTSLRESFDK